MKDKHIVVDIGAQGFPEGGYGYQNSLTEEIYLFECHPDYYKDLVEKHGKKHNYYISNVALSDKKGTADFYMTQKRNCSSLREPNKNCKSLKDRPDITSYKKTTVKTDTMDNLLGHLSHIDNLKLDTQGSEYEILQGGKEILKRTNNIKVEVEFEESYIGQKQAEDIDLLLTGWGFRRTSQTKNSSVHGDYYYTRIVPYEK